MYNNFNEENKMPEAKAKTENYTAAQAADMKARYVAAGVEVTETGHNARAAVVTALAKEYGKTERSIRSKLVREEVYIKRTQKSAVTGDKPEKKEAIAENLAAVFGTRTINGKECKLSADSMAKANKTEIATLFAYFNQELVEEMNDDAEVEAANEADVVEAAS